MVYKTFMFLLGLLSSFRVLDINFTLDCMTLADEGKSLCPISDTILTGKGLIMSWHSKSCSRPIYHKKTFPTHYNYLSREWSANEIVTYHWKTRNISKEYQKPSHLLDYRKNRPKLQHLIIHTKQIDFLGETQIPYLYIKNQG